MGIVDRVIKKAAVDTAIYWGTPVNDGYGKLTFDNPVEIKCRWVDASKIMQDDAGKEFLATAEIYPLQELDHQGLLYRGVLTDLTVEQLQDPYAIPGVVSIKREENISKLGSITEYVRKIYTS